MQLRAVDVSHSFDDQVLLRGINFQCSVGESVALVGPSGSGKTTLLSILGGILQPEAGRIQVESNTDRPVYSAWVLQNHFAVSFRSVLDNILLGVIGLHATEERVRANIDQVTECLGLSSLLSQRARNLSGGELQRVAIARALVSGADFIFADEPTSQLDRRTSSLVIKSLFEIEPAPGLVVATHDHHLAGQCSRAQEIVNGTVKDHI